MTIFELFSGLLVTLFFLFNFSQREVFYRRLARAVFERASMVNGEGSNRHCRTWCIRQEQTSLFLGKTEGFYPRTKRENVRSGNHQICSMNRLYMQWHEQASQTANYNFVQRVPNEILVSCFQPLEVIFLCLSTK